MPAGNQLRSYNGGVKTVSHGEGRLGQRIPVSVVGGMARTGYGVNDMVVDGPA